MLTRFFIVVIVVPIAVVLIALAVANRELVPFTMDPFNPGNPALTIQMPFFIYLFLTLFIGVVIGSFATWVAQHRYRKIARERTLEVENLRVVANRANEAPAATTVPAPATGTALART
ncbi:LapA family protein [Tianweitania sp. BSSL-BM11]|uniref:LapA family protein n=1 Tax=Tianweitania aestuarii TaxID=2814886 RepID=A0ABS5RQA0_9HYPH|nr:LapA family protein [Tianweitania aestuarii]MBS9719164.1 LapA family protein [Tianweitania aestuarii]